MSPETITALAALTAAIGGIVTAVLAYRLKVTTEAAKKAAETSQADIIATKDGVYELGRQLDGRLSELLKVSIAAARSEGKAEGEQTQRDRVAADG